MKLVSKYIIYLKSCRYDAKKEDMCIGMKENKVKLLEIP